MPLMKSTLWRSLLPFFLLLGSLRLVFWLTTFPNPDEAYYWLWGQHPALSYYDHPPFQAWVQGGITAVLGHSFFTLRLANVFSNGLLILTYCRITQYLYGKQAGLYGGVAIALLLAAPLYFLFLALAWHDHWLITFSLIAAFQLIRFLDSYSGAQSGESRRLYLAAGCLGLALLCKYNAVLVGLGGLGAIATTPQWRPLLRDRRLYFAIAITLCFLLPIVVWNVGNDFQSFRYYVDRSVDDKAGFQLKFGQLLVFLGVSILTIAPVNVWAIAKTIQHPVPLASPAYRPVALWIFATSTLTLMAVSLVSAALYYWNITAYLLLFPLLPPLFLRSPLAEGAAPQLARPKLFFAGQAYSVLFAALLVVHYSVLPLSVFASAESDPDSRMLYGWPEVAAAVQQAAIAAGPNSVLITTDYRSASALAYQLNNPQVLAISDRVDQFDFWYDAAQLQGKNAVILADDWHPLTPALTAQFHQTSNPVTVSVKRFGWWVKNYYIVRCDRYQPPIMK